MGEGAVVLGVLTNASCEDHGCLFIDLYRLWILYLSPVQQPWGQIWLSAPISHNPSTSFFITHQLNYTTQNLCSTLELWHLRLQYVTLPTPRASNLSSFCYFKVGKSDEEACGLFLPQTEMQITVPPIFTAFLLSQKSLTTQK